MIPHTPMLPSHSPHTRSPPHSLQAASCPALHSLLLEGGGGEPSSAPSGLLLHSRDFQNTVERCGWQSACFSSDSEHVIGASAGKTEHQLYIWNRVYGNMERILEGDLHAHGGPYAWGGMHMWDFGFGGRKGAMRPGGSCLGSRCLGSALVPGVNNI